MVRWGGLTFRKAETAAVRKNSNRMGTEEEKESWKKGDERGAGGKRNEKQIVANSSRDRGIERESAGIKARRRNGGVGRQDRKRGRADPGAPGDLGQRGDRPQKAGLRGVSSRGAWLLCGALPNFTPASSGPGVLGPGSPATGHSRASCLLRPGSHPRLARSLL